MTLTAPCKIPIHPHNVQHQPRFINVCHLINLRIFWKNMAKFNCIFVAKYRPQFVNESATEMFDLGPFQKLSSVLERECIEIHQSSWWVIHDFWTDTFETRLWYNLKQGRNHLGRCGKLGRRVDVGEERGHESQRWWWQPLHCMEAAVWQHHMDKHHMDKSGAARGWQVVVGRWKVEGGRVSRWAGGRWAGGRVSRAARRSRSFWSLLFNSSCLHPFS